MIALNSVDQITNNCFLLKSSDNGKSGTKFRAIVDSKNRRISFSPFANICHFPDNECRIFYYDHHPTETYSIERVAHYLKFQNNQFPLLLIKD